MIRINQNKQKEVADTKSNTSLKLFSLIALLLLLHISVYAQVPNNKTNPQLLSQQLRGVVVDVVVQSPVEGITVSIPALHLTTLTDANGVFRFPSVPVGVHQLVISHVGYKEIALDNITINSGKETVLNIAVENKIKTAEAIVVQATSKRNKPLNEMSAVSARAFTVEETQKYAAAVNDPSRMATSFAGVMAADDGNNNIIIRGNSPTGCSGEWKVWTFQTPITSAAPEVAEVASLF